MNRRDCLLATLIAAAGMGMTAAPVQAGKLVFSDEPVSGQYIVVLKEESARLADEGRSIKPEVASVARDLARAYRFEIRHSYSHVLRGFSIKADDKVLERLLLDDRIAYIEENGMARTSATTQPNATWGLDRVDQRDLPLNGTYVYDTAASNVHAYIVDTGIRASHNEFGGRVGSGYTAINDGNGTNDCNGHGTHVAGTVGGSLYGVTKSVRLYPVRTLGCGGTAPWDSTIAGLDWIAQNHTKPAVANLSLGGGANSSVDQAVSRLRNAGVTVVVAAGNEGQNACNVSPARSSAAITVGSTMSNDARSVHSTWASNWGSCVDIFAPGSGITAAWHTSNTATNTIGGTSMATPHVAGIAALFLANNPNATPAQVETAIYNNATPNKVTNAGNGSPTRLVYSRFGTGGGPDPDPDPDPTPDTLSNGVPVSGLSGAAGSERRYTVAVPADASNLQIRISGGSGDADLYVRFGQAPTTSAYDCRPYLDGNNETCTFASPQTGTYHVMVRGYSNYSGVTLVANWETGGGTDPDPDPGVPCTNCTLYTGALSGTGQAQVQPNGSFYYSGAGTQRGWLIGPTTADFDLELYHFTAWGWTRVARSNGPTSNEQIAYNGAAGFYYWRIVSYSGSGSYRFWIQAP